MRLLKEKLVDAELMDNQEEEKKKEEESEEDLEDSLFRQNIGNDAYGDVKMSHNFFDILKSRRNLNALINKEITPMAIINLTRVIKFLFLVLLSLSFAEYFTVINEFKGITDSYQLIV